MMRFASFHSFHSPSLDGKGALQLFSNAAHARLVLSKQPHDGHITLARSSLAHSDHPTVEPASQSFSKR